jgi:hypothetical protein
MTAEDKASFVITQKKDRDWGDSCTVTVYFNSGTFDDEFKGKSKLQTIHDEICTPNQKEKIKLGEEALQDIMTDDTPF